jgi:hypothetical protein
MGARRRRAVVAVLFFCIPTIVAQEILDRVLARVDDQPITLSDARAAIGLGLVDTPAGVDPILSAMQQLIERRLVLAEVARFAPPEPDPMTLAGHVNALKARAGSPAQLAELEKTTGLDEVQIREIARDNLRIQGYLNSRFGATAQPTDEEVGRYYRTHLDEFRKDGEVMPFAEAEPIARQRAAAERRRAIIEAWMRDLRQRADVVELYRGLP